MRLCKDCRHVKKGFSGWACAHPNNVGKPSPVTGESRQMFSSCDTMRAGPNGCGTDGKWFEPRVGVDTHA